MNLPNSITEQPVADIQEILNYVCTKSPFYKRHFGLSKDTIDQLEWEQFKQLPFTTKDDIANHNTDFLCVSITEVAEYVSTSGTSGDPVTIFLTQQDLKRLGENEAASLRLMGGNSNSIFQLTTTIDKQFMAGLAYYLGVQEMGASMIRVGPGVLKLQWKSIQNYHPTTLIAVPSFLLKLIEYAHANGIDPNSSSVKSVVCIGESIRNNDFTLNRLGNRITSQWNVDLFSTYASTEMQTAFSESPLKNGCHVNEKLIVLEVLNEDGSDTKNGEVGEIVITTLGVEGMPLVRFKTGDLAEIHYDSSSSYSTQRLGPIVGRNNQLIKFKGTTIYPKAIFEVLDNIESVSIYQVEVQKDTFGNDEVKIVLPKSIEATIQLADLKVIFQSEIRVSPAIEFIEDGLLKSRVFAEDKRKPEKIRFV